MAIFGADIPFAEHCRVEEMGVVDGRTQLRLLLRPEHINNLGIAHGGVICTLLDICMGTACRVQLGHPVMTLNMQVSFLSPGRGELRGSGYVLRAGRSVVFAEAEILNEDGELVARSSGVMKPVRREAPTGRLA